MPVSFEELSSFENLLAAFRTAARGKRMHADVAWFEYQLEWNVLRLRDQLRQHVYQPGPYRRFAISDPKTRRISAAPFRDRVVHHAICNIIEPIFERRFIYDSYANRKGKGIHQALDRCTRYARRFHYALRCDVVQFFPSIDVDLLRATLAHTIRDQQILALCDRILAGGSQELVDQYALVLYQGDTEASASNRARGLPIGNQTSQFWANCYMDPFDHFVKEQLRCAGYLRYVDDFILFSDEKEQLHHWKKAIIDYLAHHMRLILHEREAVVTPTAIGIPFLGFRVFPDHRLVRKRNVHAFARRLSTMTQEYSAGNMSMQQVQCHVQSWVAHVKHGDTWQLRRSIFDRNHIQRREAAA